MAIKVTGTTVINDSRNLENITNINDFIKGVSFVNPPQLFIDGVPDEIVPNPILITSEFSIFGGGSDTHASTDWEVVRTSDSTTVFSSIGDTTNLTSITVSTTLDFEEEYLFRVRHNGTNLGASVYREVSASTSSTIDGSDFGASICGGFYMGTIRPVQGVTYALIVAPNATGCASCQWKTTNTDTPGAICSLDGYENTYSALNNSSHPAGNWTATRTINGFSDWYLPSVEELRVIYNNGASFAQGNPLPSGEEFPNQFPTSFWSSVQNYNYNVAEACYLRFSDGGANSNSKTFGSNCGCALRAVRRVPI